MVLVIILLSYLVVTVQVDWNSFAYYRSGLICKCLTPMNCSNSTVVIKTTTVPIIIQSLTKEEGNFVVMLVNNSAIFLFSGVSQESSQTSGPLASLTTVGNLRRISLNAGNQTGFWQIHISSNSPYSIKVTGL